MSIYDKEQILNELKTIANTQDTVYQLNKSERKFILLELLDGIVDILSWGNLVGAVEPEVSEQQEESSYLVVGENKIFLVDIKENKVKDLIKLEDWEVDTNKEIKKFTRGSYLYKVIKELKIY